MLDIEQQKFLVTKQIFTYNSLIRHEMLQIVGVG